MILIRETMNKIVPKHRYNRIICPNQDETCRLNVEDIVECFIITNHDMIYDSKLLGRCWAALLAPVESYL
jgi:hypothetical protein